MIFSGRGAKLQKLSQAFGVWTVPLISADDAMPIIARHAAGLYAIPVDAWRQYHREMPQQFQVAFCRRTRASGIHNLMVTNGYRYAAANPGTVRTFKTQQMEGLLIEDLLAVRYKKLDEDGLSSNIPTHQVDDFRKQRRLPGIEAAHHFELGYQVDCAELDIAQVLLVHPSGRGNAWSLVLDGGNAVEVVSDLFQAPTEGVEVTPSRIGPKKTGEVVPLRKSDDAN